MFDEVVAVGIEHPGGHHGTRDMLRVQGAILSCLPARMLVEPWPPAKWRKACGLPGNVSKAEVMQWVIDNGFSDGWRTDERELAQDACDAYAIALATRHALRREHREAVA